MIFTPEVGRSPQVIEVGIQLLKSDPAGSYGPWIMAYGGVTFMLAILWTQSARYFSRFGYESFWICSLVVSCILLSIAQWIVIMLAAWDWFVDHYGDFSRFAIIPWQIAALHFITRFSIFVAQLFFAYRCYMLYNKSRIVFVVVMSGMLASLVMFTLGGTMIAVDPYNVPVLNKFINPAQCVNLATDVTITGLTLWKLIRSSSQTVSANTTNVLRRLRNITAEAAVPPALCALLNIVLSLGAKSFTYQFFGIMTARFYVWSLMYTLNSRAILRKKLNSPNGTDESDELPISTRIEFANAPKSGPFGAERTTFLFSSLSRAMHASQAGTSSTTTGRGTDIEKQAELCVSNPPANFQPRSILKQRPQQLPPRRVRRNSEPSLGSPLLFVDCPPAS